MNAAPVHWLPADNTTSETIPSHGVARVTGVTGGILQLAKPNADGDDDVVVVSDILVPPEKSGEATFSNFVVAAYDPADGTPAAGETWGAASGSWLLNKNKAGFRVLGGAGNGLVNVVRSPAATASASPLTTKGDIWGYSTTDARIPVGTNGQVLSANSAQSLGVEWVTPSGGTVTSVTVREDDGTPSYTFTDSLQLRFDQADGFVVSQPGAGVAKVDIAAATTTQAGVVSTADQGWAGAKYVVQDPVGSADDATGASPYCVLWYTQTIYYDGVNTWDLPGVVGDNQAILFDAANSQAILADLANPLVGAPVYAVQHSGTVYPGVTGTLKPGATVKGGIVTGIGAVAGTYTPSNVTTDRSFDANSTTLDEIADVLGTLIADLQAKSILA